PSSTDVIYAGSSTISVYRTDNGGALWNSARLGLPLVPIRSIFVDPNNATNLYAGLPGGGVYLSTDRGGTWQPLNAGLTDTGVYAVVYNPNAAPTGLQVTSADSANVLHWNVVPNATAYSLYFCNSSTSTGCGATTPGTDPGHWSLISRSDNLKHDYTHATLPGGAALTNGTAYYYDVQAMVGGVASPYSSKVSAVPNPRADVNLQAPYPNDIGVTAGNSQNTVQWSAVSGATYNVYRGSSAGFYATPADRTLLTLAPISGTSFVDTSAANDIPAYYVVIATKGGNDSVPSAEVSAVPHAMTALFAGTGGGGVFASGPAGEFRSAVNGGQLTTTDAKDISSLLIDPATLADPLPTLYAGTRGGVYRTLDGGGNWAPVGGALPPVLS